MFEEITMFSFTHSVSVSKDSDNVPVQAKHADFEYTYCY